MEATAPPPATAAALAFLRRHPPFDAMDGAELGEIARRLVLGYYAAGTQILSPSAGVPEYFYLIRSGRVALAQAGASGEPLALGPGEGFSVGALLGHRPTTTTYAAAEDTFCLQLSAADFNRLYQRSERFRSFCTSYLASLLRESQRLLGVQHASLVLEQQAMNRTLRSLIRREPIACAPETSLGSALRAMHDARVGSVVVTDQDRVPQGILTRHDVLERVVLAQQDLESPIAAVMTRSLHTLPAEATAYDAVRLIAQRGVRHVPVVDEGRLIGIVTERDLFSLQQIGVRGINRTIAQAGDEARLRHAAADIRALARSLFEQGVAAEPLTLLISGLNDALVQRIVELERDRHALDGIEWCWLAFGSEGRHEQTLSTDQDNGLLFAAPTGEAAEQVRLRLLPFADAVNRTLDACGYPLCKGNIMASNRLWCLGLDEWQQRFADWIANADPQTLLNAAIFFDFRAVHGADALARALREALLRRTAATPRFLHQMAGQALAVKPPLGLLSDFVTEDRPGAPDSLDLKSTGARLFIDAARVLALGAGIAHTSTAQRLRSAGPRIGMSANEIGSAIDAFHFIQTLRLRSQLDARLQAPAPNLLRPERLNEVDRRILKESLRQARTLQRRLALDYNL